MRLVLIRHAAAVERGTPGVADDDRPLTPEGEKRFRQAARGLARVQGPPDAILTSPLPRALRTAEIASEAWGGVPLASTAALASGELAALGAALRDHAEADTLGLVGHEPHLSDLLAHLLGSAHPDRFAFKKGGAALVELAGGLNTGADLLFVLPPRVLRALGD